MNRKLIFVGLLLGLFIFPLFLNIHKVNAVDNEPQMIMEGCPDRGGPIEERIEDQGRLATCLEYWKSRCDSPGVIFSGAGRGYESFNPLQEKFTPE